MSEIDSVVSLNSRIVSKGFKNNHNHLSLYNGFELLLAIFIHQMIVLELYLD